MQPIEHIADAEVGTAVQGFVDSHAKEVKAVKQPDGTWTVTGSK